jgi:hypothetical protein
MIDLFTRATPNGCRVSIMLEERRVPCDARAVDIE